VVSLSLLVFSGLSLVVGFNSDPKTIAINRDFQVTVDKARQKREFIIPQDPLDFTTTLTWEVTISKKVLTGDKNPASFVIQEMGADKQIERKMVSSSGSLSIPKGKQYKISIDAGEYSGFLAKTGATVKAKLSFPEAQIRYALGDKPFEVDFEIAGPVGFNEWKWQWGGADTTAGKEISHQFSGDDKTMIMVEGKGKTASGLTSQKYGFEFEVPPLVVLTSKVEPLKGPAELAITGTANAVINYGQKAMYTWNFGNGIEMSGPEAHYNYLKSGRYLVTVTATVNEYKIEKTSLVEVSPETILPSPALSPTIGAIPLKVTGSVSPKISGGPAQLEYTWDLMGKETKGSNFAYTFTEPGDYRVLLKTVDKLHPDLLIPEEIILIKALPPQINLRSTASIAKGVIPLTVNFDAGLTVTGSPVELVYRWEFGDGETSMLEKPNHVFKRPGEYQVHLLVSDRLHSGNLVDTTLPIVAGPPQLKLSLTPSSTEGLAPFTVSFAAQVSITGSPSEAQFIWDFGDGETGVEQNPVHIFKQPGDYTVTVIVKDRFHPTVTDKVSTVIEVRMPKIRLSGSVSPTSGAAPLTVQCQASATKEGTENPILKYVWDFGDGTKVEGSTQSHTYEKARTYSISVTVQDETLGITEKKTFKVTVK
jgi:PKD repeat protein